jgi:hypothetical protein
VSQQKDDVKAAAELPVTKSAVHAGDRAKAHGLAVAKWTIRSDDNSLLDCICYCDKQFETNDHAPRRIALRSARPIEGFAGRHYLTASDSVNGPSQFDMEVSAQGVAGFSVKAYQQGQLLAQGMAVIDPHDARSLLISWWTGDVLPYGIVKYTIHDGQSIKAYYISEMSPDRPGRGTAVGDTSGGFAGRFALTYEEDNGNTWGPYDWTLAPRGDMIDVTWELEGAILSSGFGLIDPCGPPSIIVNYFAVRG